MKILLDIKSYNKKPTKEYKNAAARITERMCSPKCLHNIGVDGLRDIANLNGNKGHTISHPMGVSGYEKRCDQNFISTNFIFIDFDDCTSLEEFYAIDKNMPIHPVWMYHTFSSIPEAPKFRAVYVVNHEMEKTEYLEVTHFITNKFSDRLKPDLCWKTLSQMYYGGIQIIDFNIDNVIYSSTNDYRLPIIEKVHVKKKVGAGRDFSYDMDMRLEHMHPEIWDKCSIIKDLKNGVHVSYDERYRLLTNFAFIHKGRDYIMQLFPIDKTTKAIEDLKYTQKNYSHPKSCSSCSRFETCELKPVNLIAAHYNIVDKEEQYSISSKMEVMDLSKAEKTLEEKIKYAINNIHDFTVPIIVKAVTGIGKTEMLLDNMIPAVYCFPTHKLREEFAERLHKKHPSLGYYETIKLNTDVMSDEDKKNIIYSYANNDYVTAKQIIDKNKDKDEINDYINKKRKSRNLNSNEILLTTHAQLPYLKKEYNNKIFIVDEDPLETLFCNRIFKLDDNFRSIIEEEKLENSKIYNGEILRKHIGIISEKYRMFVNTSKSFTLSDNHVSLSCKAVDSLHNVIILSATITESIYKKFYDAEVHDINNVKNTGNVMQNIDKSYSKTYLSKNSSEIQKIKDKHLNAHVITHKSFTDKDGYIHLRNSEGIDTLKGKDLVIIGTPYPNKTKILLLAHTLGVSLDVVNNDNKMKNQWVNMDDGRRFKIYTFNNKELRDLHLGEIERVLLQVVGRARTLRCDCNVTIYSNFILPINNIVIQKTV